MDTNKDKYYVFRLIAIYLVILVILIDSPTMYRYITSSPIYGVGFGWPLGIACLLYAVQVKTSRLNCALTMRFPFLILLLVLYAFLSGYNTDRFLVAYVGVFIFLFLFAYALYQNGEMRVFLHAFTNVMLVIAVISLVCWLFGSVLGVLPGRTEISYDWANKTRTSYTYFWLYFENPVQNSGFALVRNMGIFTEAPGYSGFLTYAILCEVILRKELTEKRARRMAVGRILLFLAVMFTTSSTKGIIAVLIIFAYEYLTKKSGNKWQAAFKIFASVVVVAGGIFAVSVLVGAKLETGSGLTRIDDLNSQLQTFLQHPVLGAGYNNVEAIKLNQLRARGNKGLSMGLTVLLAYGGLWLFLIYAGALVVSFRNAYFRKNRKVWFLAVIVLVYNLFISNAAFSDAYIFMIAAAYAYPVGQALEARGMIRNEPAKS